MPSAPGCFLFSVRLSLKMRGRKRVPLLKVLNSASPFSSPPDWQFVLFPSSFFFFCFISFPMENGFRIYSLFSKLGRCHLAAFSDPRRHPASRNAFVGKHSESSVGNSRIRSFRPQMPFVGSDMRVFGEQKSLSFSAFSSQRSDSTLGGYYRQDFCRSIGRLELFLRTYKGKWSRPRIG